MIQRLTFAGLTDKLTLRQREIFIAANNLQEHPR